MTKLTQQQVKDLIKLQDLLESNTVHYCCISNGNLQYIVSFNTFEDEYDFEGTLEEFLLNTDIDNLDLAGIEVCDAGHDAYYYETQTFSLIDFATGYYDIDLYRLQGIEWKE